MATRIDWALPERMAFIKPDAWAWQKAHRIMVSAKAAFVVETADPTLETGGADAAAGLADPLVVHIAICRQ